MSSKKSYPIHQSPLYLLQSKKKLCTHFGLSLLEVKKLLSRQDLYAISQRKKPGGKDRTVYIPCPKLKAIQKRIHALLLNIENPSYLTAPVKGRSAAENAYIHRYSQEHYQLDIQNFFDSVRVSKVYDFFFQQLKCSQDVAGLMKELVTYYGKLPTGAPSSPIIAFYAYLDLWEKINLEVQQSNCIFTLYIDDLTISGSSVPKSLVWKVKQLIKNHGLAYHKGKFSRGTTEVTGKLLKGGQIYLPNRKHRKLYEARQELAITECEVEKEQRQRTIKGYLAEFRELQNYQD